MGRHAGRSTIVLYTSTTGNLLKVVGMVGQAGYQSGGSGRSEMTRDVQTAHIDRAIDDGDWIVGRGPEPN